MSKKVIDVSSYQGLVDWVKVKAAGITKTALTVVGDFLGDEYELSKLYDKTFTTEFRKGVSE